jgi:hypothetical protein
MLDVPFFPHLGSSEKIKRDAEENRKSLAIIVEDLVVLYTRGVESIEKKSSTPPPRRRRRRDFSFFLVSCVICFFFPS